MSRFKARLYHTYLKNSVVTAIFYSSEKIVQNFGFITGQNKRVGDIKLPNNTKDGSYGLEDK